MPNSCSISIGLTSEFGIASKFWRVGSDVVEAVGGWLDGDLGSEAILGVSRGDVSVSDVEEGTIGVLYVFASV